MVTGYDKEYYNDIRLIRHAIEKIAKVLTEPKILEIDAPTGELCNYGCPPGECIPSNHIFPRT